ncbi:MAG: S-layer homology domain-containing protein, partial [Armatimonadota bacterium]|nr:S-layer homology domain-containing protein [Armatimonadota bacterium]
MKKLAIGAIAATLMATMVSLPRAHAQVAPVNPQGVLKPEPFADVPPDHWAYNAVEFLRRQGLIDGYPDQTFKGKRPMTRYEIAQMTARMLQGLMARLQTLEGTRTVAPPDTSGLVTEQQLNERMQQLQNQMLTREQVRQMIEEELARRPQPQQVDLSNYVTREQLATLQRLVDEFRNELQRLNVDVDAVKKDLADVRTRLEAVEAEIARMPRIVGNAQIIAKHDMKSSQIFNATTGTFRPAYDYDGRPLNDDTNVLTPVLGYYDLDLGIVARPTSDVQAVAVLNIGNYASSYGAGHGYAAEGAATVTPYKAFLNVP